MSPFLVAIGCYSDLPPTRKSDVLVQSAAFSPNGERIVTASWDKTARLWDAETGLQIGPALVGHEGYVETAAFSPDGKRIVTASDDKTARVWDVGTGKQIGELNHDTKLLSAAFSPDGKLIVTAANDGTTRPWHVFATTEEYVLHAKKASPRCLTGTQRDAFFLSPEPPAWCVEMEKWAGRCTSYHDGANELGIAFEVEDALFELGAHSPFIIVIFVHNGPGGSAPGFFVYVPPILRGRSGLGDNK